MRSNARRTPGGKHEHDACTAAICRMCRPQGGEGGAQRFGASRANPYCPMPTAEAPEETTMAPASQDWAKIAAIPEIAKELADDGGTRRSSSRCSRLRPSTCQPTVAVGIRGAGILKRHVHDTQ